MGNRAIISKDQIRNVAYKMAAKQGLASLNIRAVAKACEVSVGTIYNSYPTKSDLINDVVALFWKRALSDFMKKLGAPDDGAAKKACAKGIESNGSSAAAQFRFIDFCQELAAVLANALQEFRSEFLSGISALDAYDIAGARKREQESFAHIRRGLQVALERDPAIDRDLLTGPLSQDRLCDLVWETILASARSRKPLDETLFALIEHSLY